MQIVQVKNLSYSYPQSSVSALKDISFSIDEGDYIAVVGANGSGKSTLARILAGFFQADSGSVEMQEGLLAGIVFQQPKDQIVAGIVERDTAFGPQNLDMTKGEIELRTIEALSVVSLADRAMSRTFELSLGQTQRLAFSGILALFPKLLILDEVTAMLDPKARNELVTFVDRWNEKGHTVIHITHDAEEALRAKRILFLDQGQILFDGSKEQFLKEGALIKKVFGDDLFFSPPLFLKKNFEGAKVSLAVENLSFSYADRQIFKNLSFNLYEGSLVALTGPSGCGKSTLFECLAGLHTDCSGSVFCKERPALALQESEAALFAPYAADDVAFGPKNRGLRGKALLERVKKAMDSSGLDFETFADRPTFNLSGGEKRKLSIAGIVALDSSVLIFDEPTSALDAQSRRTVLTLLRHLASEGKTVLFSTHRMEEAAIADLSLNWQDLTKESLENKGQRTDLKKIEALENAKILKGLRQTSSALMAPAKIPDSFVSHLPAAVKSLLFFILCLAAFFSTNIYACASVLLLSLLYAAFARYPLKKSLKAFVKILPWLLLFTAITFAFYSTGGDTAILFKWKFFVITKGKIVSLANTFLRVPALILIIGTFIYTSDERQILDGLSTLLTPLALIKIPVRYFVLVVGIIFRFAPLLLEEMSSIIKTQLVRGTFANAKGLKKLKILIPLFVPLLLQTFRKAQRLSDALTARYFS